MLTKSTKFTTLLLGFVPFFRKELQEWKQQKQIAIAVLLLIPFLLSILSVLVARLATSTGSPSEIEHLTQAATALATNSFWIGAVSTLLSIGLIPNEQASGTLAWNLTKPLSRLSFLLGKGLSNTISIWLVAVVSGNIIILIAFLIGIGGGRFSVLLVLLNNLFALFPIAFWVLFCLFAGMFLKDQAAIGAVALVLALVGTGISSAQLLASNFGIQLSQTNEFWIRAIATYYPTNVIDGFVSPDNAINFSKLALYLLYIAAMSIATYWMFDHKEFS